jgi:hypothetical protein
MDLTNRTGLGVDPEQPVHVEIVLHVRAAHLPETVSRSAKTGDGFPQDEERRHVQSLLRLQVQCNVAKDGILRRPSIRNHE